MKYIYLVLLIGALLLPGCGKDKVQPSEDYLLSQKVYANIQALKDAYLSKNRLALKGRIASPLSENIVNAMTFNSGELSFTQRLVHISDSTVKVSLSWQGTWILQGDRKFDNRGIADLTFNRDTLVLEQIRGDNPFILPELKKQ